MTTVTTTSLELAFEGLDRPLFLAHAGDGSRRLFIVERPGRIRTVVGGRLQEAPFLDITDRVGSGGSEQGLLGLAFSPDYASDRHLFVNYTDRAGNTVVSRFLVSQDPNSVDPGSERRVLSVEQPASNHNGGMLAFGPDGYLYIGLGDGGGANDVFENAQNPDMLLGKMLRLDVTSELDAAYTVPGDNPWVTANLGDRDVRDEIWALGLRNPWRYSFDRETGDLWIGDVGQNQYEEVDVVRFVPGRGLVGGLNFGWPIMEATHCFRDPGCDAGGLTLPVAEYSHSNGECSVTGGYVYRGSSSPGLAGAYLFGDFCSGRIWALREGAERLAPELLIDSDLALSSFGEGEDGELYALDLDGGRVYRVVSR